MDSSPPMLQVYRDDEHTSVAAPFLPINQDAEVTHPRWAKRSGKDKNVVRRAIATGAFVATYLFFCAWVAFANNGSLAQRGDSATFPHRRFPWPFPGRRHPHPHPHHWPRPEVLGCVAIPTPSGDDAQTAASVKLNVTLPGYAPIVLGDMLLHGDVSVTKVNQTEAETMSVNRTMLVGIKVANRTMSHPSPPPDAEGDSESTQESFVLCAIHPRRGPPPPPPPPPPPVDKDVDVQSTLESSEHPHPPHHPPHRGPPRAHSPPVVVAIFPALNATYPKFPGPHGPPPPHGPHGPPGAPGETEPVEVVTEDSIVVAAWKSTISFLFPMLSAFPHYRPHGPPCHHHGPPPPPPFWVTAVEATVPKCSRVVFGHGGPPPHGPWRQ